LIIATMLREEGGTGVQTHVTQLRRYLERDGATAELVTPFSWGRPIATPVYAARLVLERCSGPASVAWYRRWHEVFLREALRRRLAQAGDCVVYAQDPPAARAALSARRGPHQRVVMAVHFRISQSDEWADKKVISRDSRVFQAIRRLEREVVPQVDGLVFVSRWARSALLDWLPEAARVPHEVIGNFVTAYRGPAAEPLADLVTTGHLEPVKNHRFLLSVLAEARRTGHPLSLDIYGEGPLREELTRQIQSLGLEGQVRLRGFRRDLRDLLPAYRAYVHVSYSESSSLAIMEAMAAGLPIVAGNIGPLAELFDEGTEGRFWPLDDPAKAAAILTGLLDSEPARLAAAQAARERFGRDFDAEVVAPRLRNFLLEAA
jgi:glycosyltransferase involved in cell wall biosynthesis